VPQLLDQIEEISYRAKSYAALTKAASGYDFRLQSVVFAKEKLLTNANLAPRPDQALPFVRLWRYLPGEQYLDQALEKVMCRGVLRAYWLGFSAASPAVEACRENSGIIEHNQVVWPEQVGEVAKPTVTKRPQAAVQLQKAGCSPVRQWFLGNQFRGKVIIEL
jgi:hypothetical protein